mmetsp:Transcript_103318/g.274823  ORF Transcript_103318/g.274823 Transcript_103318/m.274823 type:complete len:211 (-) Transcript_103318:168-800(-)
MRADAFRHGEARAAVQPSADPSKHDRRGPPSLARRPLAVARLRLPLGLPLGPLEPRAAGQVPAERGAAAHEHPHLQHGGPAGEVPARLAGGPAGHVPGRLRVLPPAPLGRGVAQELEGAAPGADPRPLPPDRGLAGEAGGEGHPQGRGRPAAAPRRPGGAKGGHPPPPPDARAHGPQHLRVTKARAGRGLLRAAPAALRLGHAAGRADRS